MPVTLNVISVAMKKKYYAFAGAGGSKFYDAQVMFFKRDIQFCKRLIKLKPVVKCKWSWMKKYRLLKKIEKNSTSQVKDNQEFAQLYKFLFNPGIHYGQRSRKELTGEFEFGFRDFWSTGIR